MFQPKTIVKHNVFVDFHENHLPGAPVLCFPRPKDHHLLTTQLFGPSPVRASAMAAPGFDAPSRRPGRETEKPERLVGKTGKEGLNI